METKIKAKYAEVMLSRHSVFNHVVPKSSISFVSAVIADPPCIPNVHLHRQQRSSFGNDNLRYYLGLAKTDWTCVPASFHPYADTNHR